MSMLQVGVGAGTAQGLVVAWMVPAAPDSPAGTKREGARQEGNPGFRAREKAFADRIEKARSKAGFPKTLRMSSGGGFRQQGPGLVNEL